jgi:hypothetical protein
MRLTVVVITTFCLLAACKERSAPVGQGVRAKVEAEKSAARLPVLGERRITGDASELRASPDGQVVTALLDAKKPTIEGVPPPARVGDLWAAGASAGAAVKVAAGVTNMPGGWLFSPDSKWILASAGWDASQQVGELIVINAHDLAAPAQRVSSRVNYFVPSDDGALLAWVESGVLSVGPLPGGPWRQLAGEVSTAEFSSDGHYLYFRRRYAAAGGLYQVDLTDTRAQPRRVLDQVAEYTVLHNTKHVIVNARVTPADRVFQLHVVDTATLKTRKLADDALRFRASRDGRSVAWRTSSSKGEQADVGELWLATVPDGTPRKLGDSVKDFDFAPDGKRLVYRENYQELLLGGRDAKPGENRVEKVGDLWLVELPDGKPRLLHRRCPNFLFSPDGKALAYTARIETPDVTRRLLLLRSDATEPVVLKDWLYEYQFRPPGEQLYFRADCLREGRACDLLSIRVDAPKDTKPTREVGSVFGVRFTPDGSRAVLSFAHLTDETFDISFRNLVTGDQKPIDQYVEWPGVMLGEKGEGYAYLVHERSRAGVYVAKSP